MVKFRYSLVGGYLTAIEHNGKSVMYSPDPRSWGGTDVAIFPFVARLKEGIYSVGSYTFSMKNHGLARYNQFDQIKDDGVSALLRFESNDETKKQYPFDFCFDIQYKSSDNGLTVTYKVKNTGDATMPFGIGAHPSFKLPSVEKEDETDISGNYLEFDEEIDANAIDFDEEYKFIATTTTSLGRLKRIDLSKELFRERATLVLDSQGIKKVTLVKKDGSRIIMNFNAPYLAFWSHPQYGDYVCMEPWMSLPDFVNAPSDIFKKKTLIHLDPHQEYTFSYSLSFE